MSANTAGGRTTTNMDGMDNMGVGKLGGTIRWHPNLLSRHTAYFIYTSSERGGRFIVHCRLPGLPIFQIVGPRNGLPNMPLEISPALDKWREVMSR